MRQNEAHRTAEWLCRRMERKKDGIRDRLAIRALV